jgi:5-methylcytosine-specific restriction endonuclease McrA
MSGRVKRLRGLAEAEARAVRQEETAVCALCGRALGSRVEWHHVVPKSEGGRDTVAVHPICHRIIHASATNAELARIGALEPLRAEPAVARFLRWIADKPADFHAPTRRRRD